MPVGPDVPQSDPSLPAPVIVGLGAGQLAGNVQQGLSGVTNVFPEWLQKAGTYLTDKGTLIRIGVFGIGAVMVVTGVLTLFSKETVSVVKTVGKAVK